MIVSEARLAEALLRNDLLSSVQAVFAELNQGRTSHLNWSREAICMHIGIVALERGYNRLIVKTCRRVHPRRRSRRSRFQPSCLAADHRRRLQPGALKLLRLADPAADALAGVRATVSLDAYSDARRGHRVLHSAGGYRLATSTGGTLTSRGGDFIIVDDPLKGPDARSEAARDMRHEWSTNTLFTRLDDKSRGSSLLVQQRQHENDLSGSLLRTRLASPQLAGDRREGRAHPALDEPAPLVLPPRWGGRCWIRHVIQSRFSNAWKTRWGRASLLRSTSRRRWCQMVTTSKWAGSARMRTSPMWAGRCSASTRPTRPRAQ